MIRLCFLHPSLLLSSKCLKDANSALLATTFCAMLLCSVGQSPFKRSQCYSRVTCLFHFAARPADTKSLHEFVMEGLPAEHVANLRRRDQADKFLQSECRGGSEWGACGILFTEKFETTSALKALSFRYRGRVSCC